MRISDACVFTRPRSRMRMNSGTRKMTAGNMLRRSTEKKRKVRPGKLKREKA
ncbi:hypothetical protein D3C83_238400 [compost metagenome]